MSYVAFISYKHSETSRPHAEGLERALRRYAKPLWKPPIAIFRDERILRPGDDLPAEIRKALRNSTYLLYLASREAAESEWIQDELRIWCDELGRADRLIIVHIADTIASTANKVIDWSRTDALPRLLQPHIASIPIWTDLVWAASEPQRDLANIEYKKAVNALVAKFRNKQPGEMNDEEVLTHRRNLLLRNTGIAAIAVFALVTIYFADQARRERNAAEQSAMQTALSRNDAFQSRDRAVRNAAEAARQSTFADGQRDLAVMANNVAQEQRMLAEQRTRSLELADAFRLVDRGGESFRTNDVAEAKRQYDDAGARLHRLGLDPVFAMHASFSAAMRLPRAIPVVDVREGVSFMRVSRDGRLLVVFYDYQNFGGNPELEEIPGWTAVGVFDLVARRWTIEQPIDSPIGRELYHLHESRVVGFEAPHDVILKSEDGASATTTFERFSLTDGTRTPCDARQCGAYAAALEQSRTRQMPEKIAPLVEPTALFSVPPNDGIDVEYGPRRVDSVFVRSPDGRTAIVGTYEGKVLLLDLAAGLLRGQYQFGPVFAAAYSPDSRVAYVADTSRVIEIDTAGWPGLREQSVALRVDRDLPFKSERVLAVDLSEDGNILAIATTQRLMTLGAGDGRPLTWDLPQAIEAAADFRVNTRHRSLELVVGDDGTLISVDYESPRAPVKRSSSPTGNRAAVAWLDMRRDAAIVAEAALVGNDAARIHTVPLPGRAGAATTVSARVAKADSAFRERSRTVHAIAKMDDEIVLFYGDAEEFADEEMADERMMTLRGGVSSSDRRVFEVKSDRDNLGEVHWQSPHVQRLLPSSRPGRLYAIVGPVEWIAAIDSNGRVEETGGTLAAGDFTNEDQGYSFVVDKREGNELWIGGSHSGSGTKLRYQLPWSGEDAPTLAALTPDGRHVAVAGVAGHILRVDVAGQPRPAAVKSASASQ